MKIFLLFAVFSGFLIAGFLIKRSYKQRKVFFEDIIAFCNHLLVEISFSKNTIATVIETYGNSYALQFRKVVFGYKTILAGKEDITLGKMNAILWIKLKPPERSLIADFFYELGRHGAAEEAQKITNKKAQFDKFRENASARYSKDASIYFKICILLGVAAVILLL